jgi:hypothetical protein
MYAGRQFLVVGFTLIALIAAQQVVLALLLTH